MGGSWWTIFRDSDTPPPQVTWPLLRRVLAYARPYRAHIAGMLVCILVTTGLGLLSPLIFRELIDHVLPEGDIPRLNLLALALIAIPFIDGVISVIQRKLNATIGEGVIYDLRVGLYSHLQRMSFRFFTHTKLGELMSRLNNDVVGAQRAISDTIVSIITDTIQSVGILIVLIVMDWRLTALGIVVLPLFALAARRLGRHLRDIAREAMEHNARMNATVNETLNISGVLLVKLFGRIGSEISRFEERAAHVRDTGVRRAVIGSQFFTILGLVGVIGTALVYWLGGHLVLQGVFTIGTIVAFSSYLGSLYNSLGSLINAPVDFSTSMVSFERVFEVIDLPIEIVEKPDAIHLARPTGELAFENVSFAYSLDEKNLLKDVQRFGRMDTITAVLSGTINPVTGARRDGNGGKKAVEPEAVEGVVTQARAQALYDISFRIKPGQLAALVGPSGAGKTTMTYLIPRLYDPTAGRVTLDGIDVRNLALDTLAQQIGMVTQETHLFHDTIRTNLLYANLDATQAEIEAAAKVANIHDFIMALPDQYDTIVGERGYRLSGGEKQRIAIARVVLKDPKVLALDEATSHLDSQSEALIQEALKTVMAGRTSIVIAHRLSTILAADLILVMDRGKIVERGTHQELLAQAGLYAQLYETQFSRERV